MITTITAAILATTTLIAPAARPQQAHVPIQAIAAETAPLTAASTKAAAIKALNVKAKAKASAIPAQWQDFADCVGTRESHHNPRALNKGSGAAGKWQFMPAWRRGLPYMVVKRLKAHGYDPATAKRLLKRMHELPINKWKAEYQDIGFVAAITASGGKGWKHWYLAGSKCNALAPE